MVRRMFLLVVLIVSFADIGMGSTSAPVEGRFVAGTAAQEALLDLAWLAPRPDDLDPEGYGLARGAYRTAATTPGSVFGNGTPPTSFDEALTDAGARQTYWRRLVLRSEEDPDQFARLVDSLLIEFGDAAEAEEGFAAARDLMTDYDELRTAPEVGDEALAFRGHSRMPTKARIRRSGS